MVEWTVKEIDFDTIPDCKNPQEIVDYTLTVTSKIFPNTFNIENALDGFRSTKMSEYQVAYSLVKIVYEQFFEMAQDELKNRCMLEDVILERGNKEALEKYCEVDNECKSKFYVTTLAYLKLQAERMMVEDMFYQLDTQAPEKLKEKYIKDKEKYEYLKTKWQHPAIRKNAIELAFNFRL